MSTQIPRTLVVLGAGASKEAGLPLGAELKSKIGRVLDIRFEHGFQQVSGDGVITGALRLAAQSATPSSRDINPYLHAAWRIRDAMPQAMSIDNFIDSHAEDSRVAFCGKLAIARTILEAERASSLYFDRTSNRSHLDFGTLEPTWFNGFFQLLTENCRRGQIEDRLKSIALVVFNYDRCIEQYLSHALKNYYGMSEQEASGALQCLEVHHPYGQVGMLPWRGHRSAIEFGEAPNSQRLLDLADQLKTFTEGTDPKDQSFGRITELAAQAPLLVFLGFAFHRLNVDLLFPPSTTVSASGERRLYATAYGLSGSDVEDINVQISVRSGIHPLNARIRNQLTCAGLIKELWRSLSQVQ